MTKQPPLRQFVILAGGLGTRLGALTAETPKPLLPVADRPFLDYLLEWGAGQGFSSALLLVGYHSEQITRRYQGQSVNGMTVACLTEEAPLGTGGALRSAAAMLDPLFGLVNGDSLFDANLMDLSTVPGSWQACLALRSVPDTSRFGVVNLEGDQITGFKERGGTESGLINGGVYVMRQEILAGTPAGPFSLERDLFPRIAQTGGLVGKTVPGFFIDIGIPDDYERAQNLVPQFISGWRKASASLSD